MMLVDVYKIPIGVSLSVIGGVLILSILASWVFQPKKTGAPSQKAGGTLRSSPKRARLFANPVVIGWIALSLIVAVFILAKWDSFARGSTSEEAPPCSSAISRAQKECTQGFTGLSGDVYLTPMFVR